MSDVIRTTEIGGCARGKTKGGGGGRSRDYQEKNQLFKISRLL